MPKIFTEQDRNVIRENLLKLGLEALEKGGYKKASVEAIANQAGIGKGTFYNFFSAKEHLYYEIMVLLRNNFRQALFDYIASGSINKKGMEDFLYERYANHKNIYHYFSQEDLKIIFRKMPDELSIAYRNSTTVAAELFSGIPNINSDLDNEVVVNIMNIMGNYSADALTTSESRNATIRFLANALATYIFDREEEE